MSAILPKNVRTAQFKAQLDQLPKRIQQLAAISYQQFVKDPNYPSLRRHSLANNKKGSHWEGSFSISITMRYRAIYAVRDGRNIWYWIGSHADYNRFLGDSE